MATLRDWLFGLGPEQALVEFHEYAVDERDSALSDPHGSNHVKYWGSVASAVFEALNKIREADGFSPARVDGDGRIIERTLNHLRRATHAQ